LKWKVAFLLFKVLIGWFTYLTQVYST
jgi:hypothetical protein